jgi:hypothetical protein
MLLSAIDLVEFLKRPEGKTLEFKRDLSSPDGALKTIVAFANAAGGTMLVGVEDRSRHVRGVPDPLDLEERLANLVNDRISPRIVPEIEILPWRLQGVHAGREAVRSRSGEAVVPRRRRNGRRGAGVR